MHDQIMLFRHIISTKQFLDTTVLGTLFKNADVFRTKPHNPRFQTLLKGKLLATVFYEPSTRTRFSFESAMFRLGGEVISTESAGHFSSAMKGETLEDTIRVVSSYVDAIALRHPEIGAAEKAARVSAVPIINAGDGAGEHPTQALLDLYTIKTELQRMDTFSIALVGDLLNSRTIHSLIHLLCLCKHVRVFLISPKKLKLPRYYKNLLHKHAILYQERETLDGALPLVDVLYVTRVQKERFSSMKLYNSIKDSFVIDRKTLAALPKKAIIMHPLQRVHEIKDEVDSDVRAAYFRQAENGLYIRMALLSMILK